MFLQSFHFNDYFLDGLYKKTQILEGVGNISVMSLHFMSLLTQSINAFF
jgi:hypothetical protein